MYTTTWLVNHSHAMYINEHQEWSFTHDIDKTVLVSFHIYCMEILTKNVEYFTIHLSIILCIYWHALSINIVSRRLLCHLTPQSAKSAKQWGNDYELHAWHTTIPKGNSPHPISQSARVFELTKGGGVLRVSNWRQKKRATRLILIRRSPEGFDGKGLRRRN